MFDSNRLLTAESFRSFEGTKNSEYLIVCGPAIFLNCLLSACVDIDMSCGIVRVSLTWVAPFLAFFIVLTLMVLIPNCICYLLLVLTFAPGRMVPIVGIGLLMVFGFIILFNYKINW